MGIEELQKDIDNNYYQKFIINPDLTLIPDKKEQNTINFMKKYFLSEDLKGKRIIDVGCNFGLFSILSQQCGAEVIGVDPNIKAIEIANKIIKLLNINIEYRLNIFNDELIKDKKYDYIICCSCYHYLWGNHQDHNKIFKIFYAMGGDIFFEDALDMTDFYCNEYFERELPDKKDEYTKEKILNAAKKYYDIQHIGDHICGTRHIYWMKRKKPKYENGYIILYPIIRKENSGVEVDKIEMEDGKFYCRKITKDYNHLSIETIKKSYIELYPKIIHLSNIVKIISFKMLNEKTAEVIMNFIEGTPVQYKKFSINEKRNLLLKMIDIYYKLLENNIFYLDIGVGSFMIDKNENLTLIDLDILLDFPLLNEDTNSGYFLYNIMGMLKWLNRKDK